MKFRSLSGFLAMALCLSVSSAFAEGSAGVRIVSAELTASGAAFELAFDALPDGSESERTLYAVYGALDHGTSTNGWEHVERLATVASEDTSASVTVSSGFTGTTPCLRFILMGGITSHSYSADGLAAQWDGIDNALDSAGNRLHVSGTNGWDDISGHGWHATGPASDLWTDNSCRFTRSKVCAFAVDTPNFQSSLGTSWTIEAYVRPASDNNVDYSGVCGGHDAAGLVFWQHWTSGFVCLNYPAWASNPTRYSRSLFETGKYHHLALTADGDTRTAIVYIDGVAQAPVTFGAGGSQLSFPSFWIGKAFDNEPQRNFSGDICAIRAYTRALSAETLAEHITVDEMRFKIGEGGRASDLFRYEALEKVVIAGVNRTEGGAVESFTLDMVGDFLSADDVYAAYGAADAGVLTSAWEHVEKVGTAPVGSGTLTVPAPTGFGGTLGCIRFFRATPGAVRYGSGDYVRDRLFAQWDGADNVGVGQHDATTKTWYDLSGNGWNLTKSKASVGWTENSYRFSRDAGIGAFGVSGMMAEMGGDWTIEAYVKPGNRMNENSSGVCGGHRSYQTKNGLIFWQFCDDVYQLGTYGWKIPTADVDFALNETHHIVMTADSTQNLATFYYEGAERGSCTFPQGGSQLTEPDFFVGTSYLWENRYSFDGDIYAVRIYKRVLTPSEIRGNREIDRIRNGESTPCLCSELYRLSNVVNLDIVADSTPHGAATPNYGPYRDIVADLPLDCTAVQFYTNSAVLYECFGSVLTKEGETGVTNTALSRLFNPSDSGTWELKWLWGPVAYTLDVASTAVGDDPGIEVPGPDYNGFYSAGSEVTLRAYDLSEQVAFDHWEGDVPPGDERHASIVVTMDGNKSVRAVFQPKFWRYDAAKGVVSDGINVFKATVADGNLTLGRVQVLTTSVLDLTLPIIDTTGTPLALTGIGDAACQDRTDLTVVKLPETLESIGSHAFHNCTGLVSVEPLLPASLCYLGSWAFTYATMTNRLELGRSCAVELGLNDTGDGSHFSQCDLIGDVYLGPGVTNLPPNFLCGDTDSVVPDAERTVEIVGATVIGDRAFCERAGIKAITLPDRLESIGHEAFRLCTNLVSITPFLPASLRSLGGYAFCHARNLEGDLKISSRKPVDFFAIGSKGGEDNGSIFSLAAKLSSITLGRGVTVVPEYFCCKDAEAGVLTNVTIYGELVSIGKEAFRQQYALRDFRLNGYPELNASAFNGLSDKQVRFAVPKGNVQWDAYLADPAKVTPWNEVGAEAQAAFASRFGADAKPPVGLTVVTDRLPANQWVVRWNPSTSGTMVLVR